MVSGFRVSVEENLRRNHDRLTGAVLAEARSSRSRLFATHMQKCCPILDAKSSDSTVPKKQQEEFQQSQ